MAEACFNKQSKKERATDEVMRARSCSTRRGMESETEVLLGERLDIDQGKEQKRLGCGWEENLGTKSFAL